MKTFLLSLLVSVVVVAAAPAGEFKLPCHLRSRLDDSALFLRENVVGEHVTAGGAIARLFVPLSYGDVLEAMEEPGMARGTALALLAIFGAGVQTFDEKKREKK